MQQCTGILKKTICGCHELNSIVFIRFSIMAEEIDVRSVGTEFVRLYYTMLNEKPECVHL